VVQFEYLERATAKLKIVIPVTLMIIFMLIYFTFKRFDEAALIMATLPFALAGGVWLMWLLGHNLSVASGVGFIALAGVAAEFGAIMLLYLKHARRPASRPDAIVKLTWSRDPRMGRPARAAQGDDGRGHRHGSRTDHGRRRDRF
jgi:Cu/Ag efflux pump CusA